VPIVSIFRLTLSYSTLFNWIPYYITFLDQILNDSFIPNQSEYFGTVLATPDVSLLIKRFAGVAEDAVQLAYWSTETPLHVRTAVNSLLNQMSNTTFNPFCGEYARDWSSSSVSSLTPGC